jgi:hypothetical protein
MGRKNLKLQIAPSEQSRTLFNLTSWCVPALAGLGDQRELSAMLTKCTIASFDGQSIVLLPENILT